MRIKIKQKFFIASYEIGSKFLITNTSFITEIFPGLIIFKDLLSDKSFEIFIKNFKGPIKKFKVVHNLINGDILVGFDSIDGFIKYKISIREEKVFINFSESGLKNILLEYKNEKIIKKDKKLYLPIDLISSSNPNEFLSFGVFKNPDILLMKRRDDFKEILPIFFLYSQFYHDLIVDNEKEIKNIKELKIPLMQDLEKAVLKKDKKNIENIFFMVFKAYFSFFFIPREKDLDYQNIIDQELNKSLVLKNPLILFYYLNYLVKNFFIQEEIVEKGKNIEDFDINLKVLTSLPISLPFGTFFNHKTSFGIIDINWAKKLLKKVIIKSQESKKIKFTFQSKIKSFRFRKSLNSKGQVYKNNETILLEKDKTYYLDRFLR